MEESKQFPTPAIIKTTLNMEATRSSYVKILQSAKNIVITRDNVNDDNTKDIKLVIKALVQKKDEINRPLIDAQKATMTILKEMCAPLEIELNRIAEETRIIATQIRQENERQIAEQNKINAAKSAIIAFVNQVAVDITNAKTDDDIVAIEKKIGSEKTRVGVYGDFVPELISSCDNLRPMIKTQKDNVRRMKELHEKETEALNAGDITTATEIKATKEYYDQLITETGMRIHEKAFEQASTIDIVAPETTDVAPKGRNNWKWRIDDMKLLSKKLPQFVTLEPIKSKIDELLSVKKSDGSLRGKEEEFYCGIVFYNDKSFK